MKKIFIIVFIFVSIAVLIEPPYFAQAEQMKAVDTVYDALKVVVTIMIVLAHLRYGSINKYIVAVCCLQGGLFLSTVLYSGEYWEAIRSCMYVVAVSLLLNLTVEKYSVYLIMACSWIFGLRVFINLFTYILYPDGLYIHELGYRNCWFLGYDNVAVPILLASMCMTVIRSFMLYGRIKLPSYAVIFAAMFFVFTREMATGIIVMGLFLLYLIYFYFSNAKFPKYIFLVITNLVLFIGLVFWGIQSMFAPLLLMLNKNLTLSGRTTLWAAMIGKLSQSLLFGFGIYKGTDFAQSMGVGKWAVHAHNYYLETFYQGGLVGLVTLFMLFFVCAVNYDKNTKSRFSEIIKVTVFILLIASQLERYNFTSILFILLGLSYHVDKLEKVYKVPYPSKIHIHLRWK